MNRVKRRGIIFFIFFIIIAVIAVTYYSFFYNEPKHGGYFVLNEIQNEVNYGYLY